MTIKITPTHTPQETDVVVVMGGWSRERDVSLKTGASVEKSLRSLGYKVRTYDVTQDVGALQNFLTPTPDVVFLAVHGTQLEDGCLQGVLDIIGVPYTFSGVLASAATMNKVFAKQCCVASGVRVPEGAAYHFSDIAHVHPMSQPYVVKPIHEGSSFGVYIVEKGDQPLGSRLENWPYLGQVLVEEYIPGRDIFGTVMGENALPLVEVCPAEGFYDYKTKYSENMALHRNPLDIPQAKYKLIQAWSVQAHYMFGCKSISRSDFRYNPETQDVYFLEINSIPGLTPISLVPDAVKYAGLHYEDLMVWLVEDALCQGVEQ